MIEIDRLMAKVAFSLDNMEKDEVLGMTRGAIQSLADQIADDAKKMDQAAAKIAELESSLASAKIDAERYRFIRNGHLSEEQEKQVIDAVAYLTGVALDRNIDRMKKEFFYV